MRNKVKYYPEILRIEMKDLKDDLDWMIEKTEADFKSGKITERVCMENKTVFKNELVGVKDFNRLLVKSEFEKFDNLDGLINHLRSEFQKMAKRHGLANAIIICIERKMDKVAKYVKQGSDVALCDCHEIEVDKG